VDTAGLLWLLNGDTLVALSSEIAVIERVTGARQTYRRRAPRDGNVSLAWEMQT
jgi:hypothetical protein